MNYLDYLNKDSSIFQKRFISLLDNSNSQKYYSDLIGISPQNFNNWLKGKSMPDINGLISLSKAFGVSVDWLIGISDIKSSSPTVKDICSADHARNGKKLQFAVDGKVIGETVVYDIKALIKRIE